jgi:crossover junction endodeoxyribonuclease RuvC
MRVLGIDCGGTYTGYGVVEQTPDGVLICIASGAVRLKTRDPLHQRLLRVHEELRAVIEQHHPDVAAIEEVFYASNVKSALKLGEVRGVAMMTAAGCGLPVVGYAPLSVKSAVVGYGRAEKTQVQDMVTRLLKLPAPPEPADAADALAIAICHLHTAATLAAMERL